MDADLIVVGAGYWGVATALMAERAGHSVLLVDGARAEAASPAASGYFADGWYSGEWKGRLQRARAQAESCGVALYNSGARVHGMKDRTKSRYRQDWYTFSPAGFLALRPPDAEAEVERVGSGFVQVTGERWQARGVVVAAGAWTDELLSASGLPTIGVKRLAGSGVILAGEPPHKEVLLHEVTPYNQIAVREWNPGMIRVCATQEKREGHSEEYIQKMLARVAPYLGERQEVRRYHGWRPLVDKGPTVTAVADSLVVATGGGRIGGLMSFWAAEQALHLLGFA